MWKHLYGWPAVWISVPVLVGIGVGVLSMTPPETKIAKLSFTLGLAILLTKLSWWVIAERQESPLERAVFIGVIFASTGVLWFAGWMLAESKVSATAPAVFSTEVRTAMVADTGPLTFLMVGSPLGTASPVFYLAFIEITNLRDVPSTIRDVKIAAGQSGAGPWENLVPIHLSTYTLYELGSRRPVPQFWKMPHGSIRVAKQYAVDDLKFAAVLRTVEPAMEIALLKPIPPHTPIRAWVALHSMRHVGLPPGQIFFRIRISDAETGEHTYVTELPRSPRGDATMDIDCGTIDITGLQADISGSRIGYFGEN